ncbi:MAG: Trk system potassium transporter TrkA [Bacteroidetes bacterium]|nr:Trk system potassium transporter TrkA [Bacteroidota bacterium]
MNIVIAGDGEVGLYLAKELADENHNITIVDPHEDLLKMVESHTDLMTITGDSTSISVLNRANIKKTDLLISVVHNEKTNIITAILAKKLGAKKTIARVNSLENITKENREIYESLGIDALICPEEIAAEEIVNLLYQTAATEIINFNDGRLSLFLIKLEDNAPVMYKTLNEITTAHPHLKFRAVAIHRNSTTIIPKGDDQFLPNDLSYIITKSEGVEELLKLSGKSLFEIKNVMVVGGGRVGRTACKLLENEINIKLFESDKEKCFNLTDYLNETLVINGDARDIQLLEDEDIRGVDAFIAVTNNSETNILTCLHARKFGVKKTIALVENIDYIDISQNIGIDTIINKKLITASYIVRFTMGSEVASLKCLSGVDAEVIELVAKPASAITKNRIKNLKIPEGALIGGVCRGEESFIATGNFQIIEGDKVVVFSLPQAIHKIDVLFN